MAGSLVGPALKLDRLPRNSESEAEDDSATGAMAAEESSPSESFSDGWDHKSSGDAIDIEGEEEDTEGEEDDRSGDDRSIGGEDRSDDGTTVPEYERLRQENIRKNQARLQELGIEHLAMSLKSSGRTKRAAGSRGLHPSRQNLTVKPKPRASDGERSRTPVRYIA